MKGERGGGNVCPAWRLSASPVKEEMCSAYFLVPEELGTVEFLRRTVHWKNQRRVHREEKETKDPRDLFFGLGLTRRTTLVAHNELGEKKTGRKEVSKGGKETPGRLASDEGA